MDDRQPISLRTCFLLAGLVTAIGLGFVMFFPVTPPDAAYSARMKAYGPNTRFVPAFP
jgi:hypothetical protein